MASIFLCKIRRWRSNPPLKIQNQEVILKRLDDEMKAAKEAAELEAKAGRTGLTAKRVTSKSPYQQWVRAPLKVTSREE